MYSRDDVRALVGVAAFARGEAYARQGNVLDVARGRPATGRRATGHPAGTQVIVAQVAGHSPVPYVVVVTVDETADPTRLVTGTCSCPVAVDCKHVAAALLSYLEAPARQPASDDEHPAGPSVQAPGPLPPDWEQSLAPASQQSLQQSGQRGAAWQGRPLREVGLHVDLVTSSAPPPVDLYRRRGVRSEQRKESSTRLALRPLIRGASGRWIRTGMSWRDIRYSYDYVHSADFELLRAMFAMATPHSPYDTPSWIYADNAPGVAFWSLITEAGRIGLPLVEANREQHPVLVPAEASRVAVTVRNDPAEAGGLLVTAALVVPGPPGPLVGPVTFLGSPVGAVLGRNTAHQLVLSPLHTPLDLAATDLIQRSDAVHVPAAGSARFFTSVLPSLAQRVDEIVIDPSVDRPQPPRPVLTMRVRLGAQHHTEVTWSWRYLQDSVVVQEVPASGPPSDSAVPGVPLDLPAQNSLLDRVGLESAVLARWWEEDVRQGHPRAQGRVFDGLATADFVGEVLPALEALSGTLTGFDVIVDGARTAYRHEDDVSVSVSTEAITGDRDWFDLNIVVRAGGRDIPFVNVFAALAHHQEYLLLDDGLHFSLAGERFARLRDLIEEARALSDSLGGSLRVNRYHAGLFDELESLGVVGIQAETWRTALGSLVHGTDEAPVPAPQGLLAEMRDYQQEGFEWLAFRQRHRLGGVLADDMGLGKTIQALALILQARRTGSAPFLVVAPTSVVGNWIAEAARFTPALSAVAVNETTARRHVALAEAIAGADLVVTSYALFRLEFDHYDTEDWGGLILDEAQFVKNHQSVGYQCARRLRAPFKLALTGTPLENNLLELWSILSIVCPGLLPSPARFTEYYGRPIERNHDAARLDQLRRRIAPFVLRRTKEAVATELPEKLEHVTEVVLHARHRKIYDQYLQRERTKVLGLVDDLDSHRFEVFRSLAVLWQASLDVSLVDESHATVPSSKLDVLFEMLGDILAEGHSVLIFSQFTRFLGKVRDRLAERGIDHAYLDGRTRRRAEQIERFSSGAVPVFLISLKAGGFGLNLTAADYCILLDPWWNPAAEAQAVDRAHRIGQDRTVMVYRMVSQHTIEEKVMALKATKSALFANVVDGAAALPAGQEQEAAHTGAPPSSGTARSRSGLTAADVRELLS